MFIFQNVFFFFSFSFDVLFMPAVVPSSLDGFFFF